MNLNRNQIVSLILIAVGLFVISQSMQIKTLFALSTRDVGPGFFPVAASVGLIVCAVGKFLTEGGAFEPFLTPQGWRNVFALFGLLALYLVSMTVVGFIVATLLTAPALVWAMREDRMLRPLTLALFSIGSTVVLYVVFELLIEVRLPAGLLFA